MSGPNTADDVGKYFIDEAGHVWICESFCQYPTATLRRLESEERRGGAVGCPNLQGFTRLIPEPKP